MSPLDWHRAFAADGRVTVTKLVVSPPAPAEPVTWSSLLTHIIVDAYKYKLVRLPTGRTCASVVPLTGQWVYLGEHSCRAAPRVFLQRLALGDRLA